MKRKLEVEENHDTQNKKPKNYDNCPICLDVIQDNNYVITKCKHKFCFNCLMCSCNIKNECPLCRAEIEDFKQKKLPIFKQIDMFDNIMSSINNPYYNIFNLIDEIKEIIFHEFKEDSNSFSEQENVYKNSIIRRLENSSELSNNIDLCIMDNIHDFVNKVIIDNSIRMCKWFEHNY